MYNFRLNTNESRKATSSCVSASVSVFFKAMKPGILLLCVHVSLNLIVPQHTRMITLVRIVLQQQLATEAKPRTKLTL